MLIAERITADPDTVGGKACIAGTRLRVADVLGSLSAGDSWDDLLESFPYITADDITAALAYAADRMLEPVDLSRAAPLAAE